MLTARRRRREEVAKHMLTTLPQPGLSRFKKAKDSNLSFQVLYIGGQVGESRN